MLVTEERTDVALDQDTLHALIGVVARGPDPADVLPALAEAVVDATGCDACLVYLRDGDALRLREGRAEDAEIGLDALDRPRATLVPIVAGDAVIGALALRADGSLGPDAVDVAARIAALVAGAIDGALRFEEAQRQVAALTALTELGEEIATAARRADLYRVPCAGVRRLLGAAGCRLHLVDADGGRMEPAYASPRDPLGGVRPPRLLG